MSAGGKGDAPRPYSVDGDTFASNWERTFGNRNIKLASTRENATYMCEACGKTIPADVVHTCSPQVAPPKWRGLTEDDIEELWGYHADIDDVMSKRDAIEFARDLDNILRKRNT